MLRFVLTAFFLRFLPPVYGDALGNEFRRPVRQNNRNNRELPSPRLISSEVHRDSSAETAQFSMMVSAFAVDMQYNCMFRFRSIKIEPDVDDAIKMAIHLFCCVMV